MTAQPDPKSTVEVPRHLAWLLAGTLVVCVVGLAYLIGRESGRATVAPQTPVDQAAQPSGDVTSETEPAASNAAPVPRGLAAIEGGRSSPDPSALQTPSSTLSTPGPTAARAAPSAPPPAPRTAAPTRDETLEREAVAGYFREIESITSEDKYMGDDPKALAMALLSQATTGDAGAFDDLSQAQRSALARLRAIRVPAPCREHHRRTVTLVGDSISLLDRLKAGLLGGNIGALGELSTQAERLKSEAEQVETLAAEIKRRVGLSP